MACLTSAKADTATEGATARNTVPTGSPDEVDAAQRVAMGVPVRLLEFNPVPSHPWLTVSLVEDELRIIDMREQEVFVA